MINHGCGLMWGFQFFWAPQTTKKSTDLKPPNSSQRSVWLVVWNMIFFDFPCVGNNNPNWPKGWGRNSINLLVVSTIFYFPKYMGCHPSYWRTPSFFKQDGFLTTNLWCVLCVISMYCIGNKNPNWLSYFCRGVGIPPTRCLFCCLNHQLLSMFPLPFRHRQSASILQWASQLQKATAHQASKMCLILLDGQG